MNNSHTVLVVGATGYLGMEICRQLTTEVTSNVRGLVRSTSDPSRVEALHQMGVETIVGDIKDRNSLDGAMEGVSAVISTASSTLSRVEGDSIQSVDKEGQINVVNAAAASDVDKFVYISFTESPESFPLQDAKRAVEKQLRQSGLNYTILQPTFFMDIWLNPAVGFDFPNHKATIYGEGKNKISFIAIRDVAAFAVRSLHSPAASNATIELGGPQAMSPLEIVQIFEQYGPFEVVHVPEDALRAQKNSSTDPLQQSFAALMLTYARGVDIDMHEQLRKFSVEPTSVADYSKQVMEPVAS